MACKDCKWWVQDVLTIEVKNGTVAANTYIDFVHPESEVVCRVARCDNASATNPIIARDVKSEYLFDEGGLFEDIKESNIVASGELDNCLNFEII